MKKSEQYKRKAEEIMSRIERLKNQKQRIIDFVNSWQDRLDSKEINKLEFNTLISEKLKHRSLAETVEEYNSYLRKYYTLLSRYEQKIDDCYRRRYVSLSLILALFIAAGIFIRPILTGRVVAPEQNLIAETVDLYFNESTSYTHLLKHNPTSLMVSGEIIGQGRLRIYLDDKVVLDSDKLDTEQGLMTITGRATEIVEENGTLIETTTSTSTTNTPASETTTLSSSTTTTANETTSTVLENITTSTSTIFVTTTTLRNIAPTSTSTTTLQNLTTAALANETSTTTTEPNITTTSSTTTTIFNVTTTSTTTSTESNVTTTTQLNVITTSTTTTTLPKFIEFDNYCLETCFLANVSKEITLTIEIENVTLHIAELTYSFVDEEDSNITIYNISNILKENHTQVEINKPALWNKIVNTSIDNKIKLTSEAYDLSSSSAAKIKIKDKELTVDEYNLEKAYSKLVRELHKLEKPTKKEELDITLEKISELNTQISLIENKVQKLEFEEDITLTFESASEIVNISYITDGPSVEEKEVSEYKKIITVSSPLHYENVLAYTNITESRRESINVYWLKDSGKELFNDRVLFIDTNENGLIDKIEWTIPHLSNQSFEISIKILNVQSYPMVGGNWTVLFNTTGEANLTIIPYDDTTYTEVWTDNINTEDDLELLKISCDDTIYFDKLSDYYLDEVYFVLADNSLIDIDSVKGNSYPIKGVTILNYSCNLTGEHTVLVNTEGDHHLMFYFGEENASANNYAYSQNETAWEEQILTGSRYERTTTSDIGLVGYWSFEEGTGTTTYDKTQYGNDGTISGAEWIAGKRGNALNFNGSGDYVKAQSDTFKNQIFSTEAWVKTTDEEAEVVSYTNLSGYYGWTVRTITGGRVRLSLISSTGSSLGSVESTVSISDGSWHHIATTDSGSTLRMYIDGKISNISNSASKVWNSSMILYHGAYRPESALEKRYMNGTIDEVRIYNRSLSASEIWDHYQERYGIYLNKTLRQKPHACDDNVLAMFRMDENAFDSCSNETTALGEDDTAIPTFEPGKVGLAASFDGTDDCIGFLPDNTIFEAGFTVRTVDFWFKANELDGNQTLYEEGGSTNGMAIRLNDDVLQWATQDAQDMFVLNTTIVNTNRWYHVMAVFNCNNMTLYLDGEIKNFTTTNFTGCEISAHSNDGGIGYSKSQDAFDYTGSGNYFNGSIDEFRVSDKVRNIDEIYEFYRLGYYTNPETDATTKVSWTLRWNSSSKTNYEALDGDLNYTYLANDTVLVVFQPGPSEGIDTYTNSGSPTTSYATSDVLWFGAGTGKPIPYYRPLLFFDLGIIPKNSEIIDANLTLYIQDADGTAPGMDCYRATSSWEESVTWNTLPKYDSSAPIATFAGDQEEYTSETVSVTATIAKWVNGTYTNYGFYCKGTETENTRGNFTSSDYATEYMRPKLTILYKPTSKIYLQTRVSDDNLTWGVWTGNYPVPQINENISTLEADGTLLLLPFEEYDPDIESDYYMDYEGYYEETPEHPYLDDRDGLIGYWSLDGNGWDYSKYSNDASVINASSTPNGRIGGAYEFDGVDDFIKIDDSDDFEPDGENISIELWFKLNEKWNSSVTDYVHLIYHYYAIDPIYTGYQLFLNTNGNLTFLYGADGGSIISSRSSWEPDVWYHITAIIDDSANQERLYVNGVLDNNGTTVSNINYVTATDLYIGSTGSTNYFNGTIDEVAIYDSVLSDVEIKEHASLASIKEGKFQSAAYINSTSLVYPVGVPNNENTLLVCRFDEDTNPYVCAQGEYGNNKRNYTFIDSTNNKAYEWNTTGTTFTTTNAINDAYSTLTSDDGSYQSIQTEASTYYPYTRFDFKIDEKEDDINNITIKWIGFGDLAGAAVGTEGFTIYVYNFTGWEPKASSTSASEQTVTINLSSSELNEFINTTGHLLVVARGPSFGVCGGSTCYANISTDYIAIEVNTKNDTVSGKYDQGVRINSNHTQTLIYPTKNNFNKDAGTIEFWVKTDWYSNSTVGPHYLFEEESSYQKNEMYIYFTGLPMGDPLYFMMYDSAGPKYIRNNINNSWAPEEWHHIAVVWDSQNPVSGSNYLEMYIDGSTSGNTYDETTSSMSITDTADTMYLGSDASGANQANATFDEFAIYDYAKTREEIIQDYLGNINVSRGTIEFWVKTDNDCDQMTDPYFYDLEASDNQNEIEIYWSSGDEGLYFNIYNSTGGLKSVFNDPFMCVANRWHHIAAVWDINAAVSGSNYMELYIDGSNTGNTYSDTTSPISLTATAPLIYIGSDSSKANNCNCTIDDFKISNYAKTSSQIYPQGYELGSGESVLGTGRYAQWRAIFNTRDIDPTGVLSGVILEGTENAPTFSTYGITPDPAYTGSNLSCSALILDDYNASINVEYKWYNQTGGSGDFILGGNTTISNNSNTVVSTLGSGNTTPGEIWNCTLRAYDGTDYSEYVSDAITISSSALALNTTRLYPLENLSINITGANNNCTIYIKRPDNHTDSFNGTVIDEICYASSIPSYLNGTYYINGTADGSYTTTLSFNVSTNWTNIIINDFQSNVSLIQIWDSFNLSLNLNDTQSNTLTGFTSNSSDPNFNYDIQGPSESCGIDIKREIIRIDENGTATARLVVEFDSGGWGGVGWEEEFKAGTNVTITILGKDGISPMNSAIAITNGTINGGGYIAHELVNNSGIYTFYVNVTSEIFDTMRGAYIEFIIPLPNSLSDVVARIDYIRFYYDSGGEDNISIADKTIEAGETGDVIFSQNSEFAGLGRFPIYLTLNPNYHGTIWYPINSSLSIENLNGELSETNGYYSNIWTWDDYVNTNFSVRAYADRWGYQSDLSDSVAININNSNYDKDLFINDFQANTTYYYPGESINLSFYLNNSDSIAQADYLTNLSDWNPDYRDVIKNEATALEIRREIDSIAEDGTVTAKVIVEFDAAGQLGIGNEAEILAGTNVTISIFGKDGVSPVSSGISLSTAETDPDYVWTNLTNSSGTYTFKAAVLSTISSQTEQGYLILTIPPHLSLSDTIIRIDYIKYVYDYGSPDYIYINDQYVQDENLSGGDYGFVIYDTGDLFSTSIGRFPVYLPLNPNENGTVYFALDSNLGFNSVSSQIYSGSGHYSNIFIWDDYVLDNISSFAYADKWPYNKALSGKRNFTLNEKNLTLSVSNITANTSYYFPNSTIEFNTTLVDKNNLSLSNFNWSDYGMDIYSRNNQESALEIRREIVNISSDGSITARLIVELDSAEDTSAFNDNPYINSGTTVNLSVYGSDGFSPLPGDISIINRTNDTNARTSHTFANNTGIYSLSVSLDTNIEGEVIQVYLEFSIPPNRSLADIVFSVNSIYFKYDSGGTDYIIVGGTTVTDPQGGTGIAEYNTGDEFATSNKFPIYLPLSMPSYGTLFLKAFSGNNGEPINGNLSESYGNYTLLHTWETESIDDFNVSFCANKWQYNNGNLTCTDNAIVLIRAKPIIDNVSDGYDYPNKVEIGENVTFVINYTLDPEPDEPAKLIICNSTNINSSGCSDKEFCQSSYSTDRKQNCSYEVEWGVFEEENVSYWVKICTDSGACSNLSNEYNFTVNLTSETPRIFSNETIPSKVYYTGAHGTTFVIEANVSDNNLLSVNFTLTNPSNTNVIDNVNASSYHEDLFNSSSYTIDEYGQWNYTITAWDADANSESDYGNIKFLQITETLSPSTAITGQSVNIYGHINDSSWNDVINTSVYIHQDGSLMNVTGGWNCGSSWWDCDWTYKKQINISLGVESNLNNTITLVNFSTIDEISAGKIKTNCG
ncbi:DNRLRE domain-containing protein, partial [Candidatus Woesearchaeota archaeon]|nr:DNRLRE domain-containing protein [Candidatus Woesearchaeota archaeon]